jgi:L-threonylcarbamoyladenylate synthase
VIIGYMTNAPARRHTRVLRADVEGLRYAAEMLRAGRLVAFPTETVYGLGAHALDAHAVRGIFEAKCRPADDPLIVHVAEASHLERICVPNELARRLGRAFWPGPLTLVLPKVPHVPAEVTAGLDTVAVRVPAHPTAHALLEAAALPVAAPSANLFGRPSPTRAAHVLEDLDGRIDALVDGGPTDLGLESTIIDVSASPPRLLRPGGVPAEAIEAVLGLQVSGPHPPQDGPQPAPGLMPVHYSPRTPLVLFTGGAARARLMKEAAAALAEGQRVGIVALDDDRDVLPSGAVAHAVGSWFEPESSARRLFDALRALDAGGLDVLFARDLADPSVGIGRALADRLRRAARRVVDSRE